MNPTDKVDDLLAKAGAQWRAGQPSAPEPDLDRIVQSKRSRRWVPALAAASVAAIAAAALIVLPDNHEPQVAPVTGDAKSNDKPAIAQGNTPDDLLVRNGDKVVADGTVLAVPGQDPLLCTDMADPMMGTQQGDKPAPSCPVGMEVKLTGLDLDKVPGLQTSKGVRYGPARLVGVWSDRSLAVEEQGPRPIPTPGPTVEEPVPCAAPAGGWPTKPTNILTSTMTQWLQARANQVDDPALLYPKGRSRGAPTVVRIGVAHGDLDAFRREIAKVYTGNLCVVRARFSRTDTQRIQDALMPAFDQKIGLTGASGPGLSEQDFTVQMLVFDEKVRAALTPVGLDQLTLQTQVKPLR